MVTYMTMPQNQLTLGATEYTNELLSARVQRVENGFDSAVIVLEDTTLYPTVTAGTAVQLDVKDRSDVSYTTVFKGIVRFPVVEVDSEKGNSLTLHCDGAGYGLSEMQVATEYGSQSINPTLDTITEILTDATNGIIPKFTNKILNSATDSGYAYTTASVETISDVIPYVNFTYKPVDKCLNDLIDLVTALKAGTAGPHWIVTTDDALRVKLVSGTQTGWTKYYGNSQANATLTYGTDYMNINLEALSAEANYILYYGAWRRPSNGDAWTENKASTWGTNYTSTLSNESTTVKVNTYSLKAVTAGAGQPIGASYPSGKDLAWDFETFPEFNVPYLNFYMYRHGSTLPAIYIHTADVKYFSKILTADMGSEDVWYHFHLPVGPHYKAADSTFEWTETGAPNAPDWGDINYIQFLAGDSSAGGYIIVDGLYFGDAKVCRVAWNSDLPGGSVCKMRIITDDVGKDDSLKETDDSGLMAQLAYSELLRLQKTTLSGPIVTPMIKDALPGQWFYVQETDFRATKIVHTIDSGGYTSQIYLTDDVTNGRARLRYEDTNKVWESIRPEWQDRQASNIKAGSVDWRVARFVVDYALP